MPSEAERIYQAVIEMREEFRVHYEKLDRSIGALSGAVDRMAIAATVDLDAIQRVRRAQSARKNLT